MIDLYCERVGSGLWAEPLNAVTNLAFIVAALFSWRLAARQAVRRFGVVVLVALIAAIGFGSFLFHVFASHWAMAADVIPILLFQGAYLWVYSGLVMHWGRAARLAALAGFGVLLVASVPLADYANGSPGYLPAWLALTFLGLYHRRHVHRGGMLLLSAAGLFLVSLLLRTLDPAVCADMPVGTHFLWHLLNGLVLYLVMRALLLGARPTAAAT